VTVLVTGGAGFIGSALVRHLLLDAGHAVVNLDALTYSANPASLADLADHPGYRFVHADICDAAAVARAFDSHDPDAVINLAAESHVDRSIDAPAGFLRTNVEGTYVLLEAARRHWQGLDGARRERFRFHQVSTDEVYGALGPEGRFTEDSPYRPSSPYSASKAAADHLALAWQRTYGLPVVISNCTNNYGPRQFPEKLMPLVILNALEGRTLPVYGDGGQVRDWLHVEDHARALVAVLTKGRAGRSYNIGAECERRNIDVVRAICRLVDEADPGSPHGPRERLIEFVADRPGHDRRYAMDPARARAELGWNPEVGFDDGLARTVRWYLDNESWWRPLRERVYGGERLGLGTVAGERVG
jgi:dTDP-glucose 4,6-dehydratase